MTQEFVPSIRAPGNPLQRFRGKGNGYTVNAGQAGGRQYTNIEFLFTEVEVIKSTEPFLFPIAQFTVKYSKPSDRGRPGQGNRWEVMSASLRKLLGVGADIKDLEGKMQEWAMLPGTLRLPLDDEDGNPLMEIDAAGDLVLGDDQQPRRAWGDVQQDCWQLVALEGAGSVEEVDTEFMAHLCELADGKDDRAFYEAAFGDPKVTGKPDIIQAITDRQLIQTLLDAGRLVRSADGILHKAGE